MSNIYNTQPPTKGKVVLVTSHGDVDVELWAKEAPKVLFLSLSLFCLYAVAALTHRRRSPSPHLRPAPPGWIRAVRVLGDGVRRACAER
jgi:hypothetical protein